MARWKILYVKCYLALKQNDGDLVWYKLNTLKFLEQIFFSKNMSRRCSNRLHQAKSHTKDLS